MRAPHRLRPVRRPHRTAGREGGPARAAAQARRNTPAASPTLGFARAGGPPSPLGPHGPAAARPEAASGNAGPYGGFGPPPPVVSRIRTHDRVVFLTYDDGAEKDPRFVDLVGELRLPVSMFLTDSVAGPGYGHFARLRSVGASIQNHTLDHPAPRGLPYAGQRAEICGQQDKLRSRFGSRPRLFRPPYGTYDTTTRRAAAACGISALVLWRASMTGGGELTYLRGVHRLRPGDIVALDPDEGSGLTLRERTVRLLRRVQADGLTVGRPEDYV
ncbi:peptidoglycan/xylan/chitin deacetylase (PgdA/CDA1 family) [Streptomyces sp. TLI_185]|nr:peptidoglycan/xylan/chitin deacetylase (PgdA/CDA1 family) [Streptomyces sp. TLI_185]